MHSTTFDEVLDAVEHLPVEQQADLVEVVRRRLAERGRQQEWERGSLLIDWFAITSSDPLYPLNNQ